MSATKVLLFVLGEGVHLVNTPYLFAATAGCLHVFVRAVRGDWGLGPARKAAA